MKINQKCVIHMVLGEIWHKKLEIPGEWTIASVQIQIPINNLFKFHYGPMDSLRIGDNMPLYICMYVCVRNGIRGKFLLNK